MKKQKGAKMLNKNNTTEEQVITNTLNNFLMRILSFKFTKSRWLMKWNKSSRRKRQVLSRPKELIENFNGN